VIEKFKRTALKTGKQSLPTVREPKRITMLRALGMGTQKNPGRIAGPGSVAATGGDSGKDVTDLQRTDDLLFCDVYKLCRLPGFLYRVFLSYTATNVYFTSPVLRL
jgi:hypothetical protein